jgi:spore germination protein GerM
MTTTIGGRSESDHVFFRISALRQQKAGPEGYANVAAAMKAQLAETTVETPGTVIIGFLVPASGDWGVSADQLKLLLQQLVFTATEEPTIDRVLITQNGGKPAVIAGQLVDTPLGRAEVR